LKPVEFGTEFCPVLDARSPNTDVAKRLKAAVGSIHVFEPVFDAKIITY
jgi:hypothetical protein